MTISSTNRKAGPYTGNDATTVFPFSFKVFSASDILVVRADATGAETILTLNSDYTVSLNANQDSSPGGSVTLPTALASTLTLTITSAVPNLQPTDLTNNGGFFPKVLNATFDRIVIQIQQLAEALGRSLKTSVSTPDGVDPTLPTPVPYQLIGWNATGTGLQNTDPTYSTALATDLASASGAKGAALVGFSQSVGSAAGRTVLDKLRESISVKDYGAKGDGSTNDTAAIQAAHTAAKAAKVGLYFPAGIYKVDKLVWGHSSDGIVWHGDGINATKLVKISSDGAPILQIGSPAATSYSGLVTIRDIAFVGVAGNTAAGVLAWDMVRSTISRVSFSSCVAGIYMLGGIVNTIADCVFANNAYGVKMDKFTSLAGGGYPNMTNIQECAFDGNTSWAIWFSNGRVLNIDKCDVEISGTIGNSSTGGIYVDNVNSEGGGTMNRGAAITDCWIEGNTGDASVVFASGLNTISRCLFQSNPTSTYDIHITGGKYTIESTHVDGAKTANIREEAGVSTGNAIINSVFSASNYDSTKTVFISLPNILFRGGAALAFGGYSTPFEQSGSATTSSSALTNITFPVAFSAPPRVFTEVANGDSTTDIVKLVVSAVSASGFSVRALRLTSGSSTVAQLAAGISWRAVGDR